MVSTLLVITTTSSLHLLFLVASLIPLQLLTTVLSCALLAMATVASLGFVIAAAAESEACAALCRRPRTRGRPRVEELSVRCRGLGS